MGGGASSSGYQEPYELNVLNEQNRLSSLNSINEEKALQDYYNFAASRSLYPSADEDSYYNAKLNLELAQQQQKAALGRIDVAPYEKKLREAEAKLIASNTPYDKTTGVSFYDVPNISLNYSSLVRDPNQVKTDLDAVLQPLPYESYTFRETPLANGFRSLANPSDQMLTALGSNNEPLFTVQKSMIQNLTPLDSSSVGLAKALSQYYTGQAVNPTEAIKRDEQRQKLQSELNRNKDFYDQEQNRLTAIKNQLKTQEEQFQKSFRNRYEDYRNSILGQSQTNPTLVAKRLGFASDVYDNYDQDKLSKLTNARNKKTTAEAINTPLNSTLAPLTASYGSNEQSNSLGGVSGKRISINQSNRI